VQPDPRERDREQHGRGDEQQQLSRPERLAELPVAEPRAVAVARVLARWLAGRAGALSAWLAAR
jgi:hypothetical protein